MARLASTRHFTLLLILVSFLVGCEIASAVDESKISVQGSETRRLLRSDGETELSQVNEEERAITDIGKSLKTWAKNTHVVKNWQSKVDTKKVEKAKELYQQGASYQYYLKEKISPRQLYRALDLEDDVGNALKFGDKMAKLQNNPRHMIWRKYVTVWTAAQNKKRGIAV